MASDSNVLRNQIFGKVAHLVVGERGLVKPDDRPTVNHEFRISTNVSDVLNQQMVSSRIADAMVIEVFIHNKQASPGEIEDILLERWQLSWYRLGRTGVQAWTGLYENHFDKTVVAMLRRVAVSGRLTQTMHLLKKAIASQYEIEYRILQTASTKNFGATDLQTVIFHGHEGHTWWHINNHTSLSFTLAYRSSSWTPRSLPTRIAPLYGAIINDYNPGAASSTSPSTSHSAALAHANSSSGSVTTSNVLTSGNTNHSSAQAQHAGFQPAPGSGTIPIHNPYAPPSTASHSQTGPTYPYPQQTTGQHSEIAPINPYRHPNDPQSIARSPVHQDDEYAADPMPHHVRSSSGQIHGAYFNLPPRGGASPSDATISTSLPKNPSSYLQGMVPPSHPSVAHPGGLGDPNLSPRTGSLGAGFVGFGTPTYVPPHGAHPPTSNSSGIYNPSTNPYTQGTAPSAATAASSTSPKHFAHPSLTSQFGSALTGHSPDRVPGSSPPSSSDRPVRTRSASNSASQILSSASTSISPYRVDLTSTMAKSPPSHQIGLPLDMIGPGNGPSRPPSSGKLPITFGTSPPSQYQSPPNSSSVTHSNMAAAHAAAAAPSSSSSVATGGGGGDATFNNTATSSSGHTTYSTTQSFPLGSPITSSLLTKGSTVTTGISPYITSSTTSDTRSPDIIDPYASGVSSSTATDSERIGAFQSTHPSTSEWYLSLSKATLPPVVQAELSSLALAPILSQNLSSHEVTARQETFDFLNPHKG